jgi:hypothetical protein
MGMVEGGGKIMDLVEAQLVECATEPAETLSADVSAQSDVPSTTQKAAEATLEQTGADPPPAGDR